MIFVATAFAPFISAQTKPDAIRSLAGQQFLLLHRGDQAKIKLPRSQIGQLSGLCDAAVSVNAADRRGGKVDFLLEYIGSPSMPHRPNTVCSRIEPRMTLEISGFADSEPDEVVAAAVRQILLTPEEYLRTNGVAFNLLPGPDEEPALPPPTPVHPNLLLKVDGAYTDEARSKRIGGSITVRLIVGTDGRVHRPEIVHGLGSGLDESAIRALALWRFDPATQNGNPVASPATVAMSFSIL